MNLRFLPLAALGLPGLLVPSSVAGTVNFSVAEGYAAASVLNDHPDWIAQPQWTIAAVGDGVAQEVTGLFARGNYRGASAPNTVLDRFSVSATFRMIGNHLGDPEPALADWAEAVFILNVTETDSSAPEGRMGAALALEDDVDPNTLEFRFTDAASGTISLGDAANFNGHTFVLTVDYQKLDATTYSVTATLDSLDDAAPAFVITDTMVTPAAAFAEAGAVHGVMQTVSASAAAYAGVQVDQFRFEAPEPTVIPSAPVTVESLAIDSLVLGFEREFFLQAMSDQTPGVWQDVPGSGIPAGTSTARFIDFGGFASGAHLFRLVPGDYLEDFDSVSANEWTTTAAGLTTWELGTPAFNTDFGMLNNAFSGTSCWGTNLDGDYATGTDTTLTSPVIELSPSGPLTLEWMEWADLDDTPALGDQGLVTLVDLDANTSTLLHTTTGLNHVWTARSVAIPAAALGHAVQIEFRFTDDGESASAWGGWYIDDVRIHD